MSFLKSVLLDQALFETEAELQEFLQENEIEDSTVVHTLILDKEVFKTTAEAIEWVRTHCFSTEKIDETDDSFRILQIDPSAFVQDSFKTIEIRRGVSAVVGKLREVESEQFMLSLRNEEGVKLNENLPSVIEIAKVVDGVHPAFGRVTITPETLNSFIANFKEKVTGVDLSIDYDHETREAAGWVRDLFLDIDGVTLLAEVRWTPKGALSLSDREFRYFSPEFSLNYVHPHTGKEHGPTLLGGALVNRPFLKMEPIVSLKDKSKKGDEKMETISLADHNAKVTGFEKQISDLKLSEEKAKGVIGSLKEENTKLSEENKTLKADAEKRDRDEKLNKLFSEGKINTAQLEALREGKDQFAVLELGEKLNTKATGSDGSNDDAVVLSAEEKGLAQKMGLTDEEWSKYSGGGE